MKYARGLFPLLAVLFSATAFYYAEFFVPMKGMIVPLLGIIMFSMGLGLTKNDFSRVLGQKQVVGLGLLLQFSIMPVIALLLAKTFNFSNDITAGLVLLGACPGGTASNLICYLSKGDVALSITITTMSTLLAIVMTPFLSWLYLNQMLEVPVKDMLWDIVRVILIPVGLGFLINCYFTQYVSRVRASFPYMAMAAIIFIIGIIVALNASQFEQLLLPVLIVVILHNLFGLLSGYYFASLCGYSKKVCRTLAIEVGMQNSGLGVALAIKYFPVAAALPGALFSIWHNISGAIIAAYWSKKTDD